MGVYFLCQNIDGDEIMWINYNPNPEKRNGSDCVYRALSKALNQTWEDTYWDLAVLGAEMGDAPIANHVWAEYLKENGFKRYIVPDTCPACYTVKDFCENHPTGLYVLGTGSHVVTVYHGNYFDSWDSGNEVPIYFWRKTYGI